MAIILLRSGCNFDERRINGMKLVVAFGSLGMVEA